MLQIDPQLSMTISSMVNGFRGGRTDPDALLASLERATQGFSREAVLAACARFEDGDVPKQSMTQPPTVPEFKRELRHQSEILSIRGRSQAFSTEAPERRGPSPYEVIQEQERVRMAGRLILAQNVSADEFRKQCRAMKWPVNSEWLRGTVYGPMEQM